MLFKLSAHISNCLQLAALAERRAEEATDPTIRSDNERQAQSWRHLASSYQFVESLERFLSDREYKGTKHSPPEGPPGNDEVAAPERPFIRRRRFKQTVSFKERLLKAAQEARRQAAGLSPGPEQDRMLMKAEQCETAADIDAWASSSGSKSPDTRKVLARKPKR